MLNLRSVTAALIRVQLKISCFCGQIIRDCHHDSSPSSRPPGASLNNETPGKKEPKFRPLLPIPGSRKYKVVEDDYTEIFDIETEKERFLVQDEPEVDDKLTGLNLNRGLNGVYDIEDLVEVLRKENAEDIFVCAVPPELSYVDYMVVCSGRSFRHMSAIIHFVRRVYKTKRNSTDILPRVEGERSRQWMALDLGNIALHVFQAKARELYDLESLWAIGAEYDKECNKPSDPVAELFAKRTILLADIKKPIV